MTAISVCDLCASRKDVYQVEISITLTSTTKPFSRSLDVCPECYHQSEQTLFRLFNPPTSPWAIEDAKQAAIEKTGTSRLDFLGVEEYPEVESTLWFFNVTDPDRDDFRSTIAVEEPSRKEKGKKSTC